MTGAEHFAWARDRAMAYVEANQPEDAMTSLISDLRKHPDTAALLDRDQLELLIVAYEAAGAVGVELFIRELSRTVSSSALTCGDAP